MLKSFQKAKGAVTLFHLPGSKTSQALASHISKKYQETGKHLFDIEITDQKPTSEQVKSILSYLSTQKLVKNDSDDYDLPKDLRSVGVARPILVDWFNGKVAVDDEEAAKKILADLAKQV